PITILWVVGITNAINLIDGLDGLATGVSTIGLLSMFVMSLIDLQLFAAYLSIVLIGANLGFLYHNFYPAKIYMGDTGSNFLGYMIAVISMLGLFKNVAILAFVIPVIILALPIFETVFSIVRILINKQRVMEADNKHIHYQLLHSGFTPANCYCVICIRLFIWCTGHCICKCTSWRHRRSWIGDTYFGTYFSRTGWYCVWWKNASGQLLGAYF